MNPDLEPYLDANDRVIVWPSKKHPQRRTAIMRYVLEGFEPGRTYTEPEVNEILNARHAFEDPAFLRRELVDRGCMERTRDCRAYWRSAPAETG